MWLMTLPSMFLEFGISIVENIWLGVATMWESFMGWLDSLIQSMIDKVTGAFSWVAEKAQGAFNWLTGDDEENPNGGGISPSRNTPYGNPSDIGTTMASTKGAQAAKGAPVDGLTPDKIFPVFSAGLPVNRPATGVPALSATCLS